MKEVLPKEFLDNLMMEYNWKRNNLDSNIEFICYKTIQNLGNILDFKCVKKLTRRLRNDYQS